MNPWCCIGMGIKSVAPGITSTEMTHALRSSSPGSDCSSRWAHLHATWVSTPAHEGGF